MNDTLWMTNIIQRPTMPCGHIFFGPTLKIFCSHICFIQHQNLSRTHLPYMLQTFGRCVSFVGWTWRRTSNALDNRSQKSGNGSGITTGFVAVATVGHGGVGGRYATSHKLCMPMQEMHGSKNVLKENHLETSSTIPMGPEIQEINPGMFGGHRWCFFFRFWLSTVFVGWYWIAYDVAPKPVGNEETLCAGRNNCCFAISNV